MWATEWWNPYQDTSSIWSSVEILPKMPTAETWERWESLPPSCFVPCLCFMASLLSFITVLTCRRPVLLWPHTLGLGGSVEVEEKNNGNWKLSPMGEWHLLCGPLNPAPGTALS